MNRSATISEFATAFSKAQGQMVNASKSADNSFFNKAYADLAAIVDAIKKPLADNGLCYVQTTDISREGEVIVETTLLHNSGEWISSLLAMRPVKTDPQGIGSCLTYARRYALQTIMGLAAEDDDGNAASGTGTKVTQPQSTNKPPATEQKPAQRPARPSEPAPKPPLVDIRETASEQVANAQPTSQEPDPLLAPTPEQHAEASMRVELLDAITKILPRKGLTDMHMKAAGKRDIGVSDWQKASIDQLNIWKEALEGMKDAAA